MSTKYGKPPITEAILDIRVEQRPGVSAIEIAQGFSSFNGFSALYPNRQELPANNAFQISLGPNAMPPLASGAVLGGFRYESLDQKKILQARREAFVFSLLPPYDSWEAFSAIARPMWDQYRESWRPRTISRIALRYVNLFVYSLEDMREPQRLIGLLPNVPHAGLIPSARLANYSLRMVIAQEDIGATAIVQQAVELAPTGDSFVVSLDIDLFKDNLTLDSNDNEGIWDLIAALRLRKNDLFHASITDEAEERLERMQ